MTEVNGSVLIFSGPHGAGKDTLEGQFRQLRPGTERIVRHITRPMALTEADGRDYYFIDEPSFTTMVEAGDFVEHSVYPDCMAGTSRREITKKVHRAEFASLAANFEEGLALHGILRATGLTTVCFFISPVPREVMQDEPDTYLEALRLRMERRGRPDDRITNKLAKAASYRLLYLQNESVVAYINNSDGNISQALRDIDEVCRTR